jgi:hypothetical protein
MTTAAPKSITVDGKEYPIAQFSETVQRLVSIHTSWSTQLVEERLDVAKTEAAIRAVDAELSQLIAAELNPPVAQPDVDAEVELGRTAE